MVRRFLFILAIAGVSFSGSLTFAGEQGKANGNTQGTVYVINNDAQSNAIAVFNRNADGSLTEATGSPFATGGKGLAGGDIDEQGAIRIHGNHILAVNPGSNSIAVLQKNADGKLIPVEGSPFSSGGDNPLSLTVHGDLIYVANQAPAFAKPAATPNLQGFRIDKSGKLTPIANSKVTFPESQGPAQVEFSPDGQTVVVTSGFQEAETTRVHAYKVQEDGTLKEGPNSPVTPKGASGTVGFSWSPESNRVYVSNFRGSSVIVFDVDRKTGAIKQASEPQGDKEEAACWTTITPDGKTLYVGNFVSNSISVFDVSTEGNLNLLGTTKRRGPTKPDTKDLILSKDGKYLYAVGSGDRQIAIFKIGADRLLTELPAEQSPAKLGAGQNITGIVND
jgi:6-phosphogluconolactonase